MNIFNEDLEIGTVLVTKEPGRELLHRLVAIGSGFGLKAGNVGTRAHAQYLLPRPEPADAPIDLVTDIDLEQTRAYWTLYGRVGAKPIRISLSEALLGIIVSLIKDLPGGVTVSVAEDLLPHVEANTLKITCDGHSNGNVLQCDRAPGHTGDCVSALKDVDFEPDPGSGPLEFQNTFSL